MDCRGASEEDIEYMKHWLRNEGNIGVLDLLDEDGIDLLKNAVEFYTYGVSLNGGVSFNTRGETSIPGIYCCRPGIFRRHGLCHNCGQ